MRKRKLSLKVLIWLSLFCMVTNLSSPALFSSTSVYAATPRNENFDLTPKQTTAVSNPQTIGDWTFSMLTTDPSKLSRTQVRQVAPGTSVNLCFLGYNLMGATDYGRVQSNTGAFKLLSFNVIARNTDTYTVQGYLNGQQVAGATKTFTPTNGAYTNVDFSSDSVWQNIDEFRIYANVRVIIDFDDLTVTDPVLTQTNAATPSIDMQPADQTVNMGESATLSVAASGGVSLSYQWYSNTTNSTTDGTPILGATTATYAAPTGSAGTTYYYVVVTNTDSSATGNQTATATSNVVAVTVNSLTHAATPSIDTQPTDQTVNVGESATLSVAASGGASLSYQWYSNTTNSTTGGTPVLGATTATYAVPTGSAGTTYYYVVVTNTDNSATGNQTATATSSVAKITVTPAPVAPTITTEPSDQTVTAGGTATFTVIATGDAPLSYQWKKDGIDIAGATSASLTINNAQEPDEGSYTVEVTNAVGNVTSTAATLTVTPAPVAPILQQNQVIKR
ncbi:immunoglobulin I-set domain-containing protein [Schinkia azotoformans MEV2011]|uniref:Immunoglobulin I-set domain-containing protein n=1 Tax=Schinkia azotoformans MEV2011 TaxID=1348973 RepID=A0A072NWQ9_SCHAZ|nr:immunoglobulin domain-containing protein [Schinkia azotoformans]KEF37650.1 immunoglobulin I-set domain-containing protein [Schinkia azotoformans MEV2011]